MHTPFETTIWLRASSGQYLRFLRGFMSLFIYIDGLMSANQGTRFDSHALSVPGYQWSRWIFCLQPQVVAWLWSEHFLTQPSSGARKWPCWHFLPLLLLYPDEMIFTVYATLYLNVFHDRFFVLSSMYLASLYFRRSTSSARVSEGFMLHRMRTESVQRH